MAEKELIIYLNGEFVPESEAKISIYDRCFLYGDGIFDGTTVWGGVPFRLDAHLKRMYRGLFYLKIENPLTDQEWKKAMMEMIRLNEIDRGYLRPQVSRGEGMLSTRWEPHVLKKGPYVVIIPDLFLAYGDSFQKGFRAKILSRPRVPSISVPAAAKHCNYLNTILGGIEVSASGNDIGIAINSQGYVTEGIAYNIFMVRDGALYTPPLTLDLLPGITREVIIEIARREGYKVFESVFDAYNLCTADEVFFCSTVRLGGPVIEIDGRKIGDGKPGQVTRKLGELLLKEMDKEAEEFRKKSKP